MLEANASVVAHSLVLWKLACMLISKPAFLVLMGISLFLCVGGVFYAPRDMDK